MSQHRKIISQYPSLFHDKTQIRNREKFVNMVMALYEKLMFCVCSVAMLCPMDCDMPGLPIPHHFLEFAQVQVH